MARGERATAVEIDAARVGARQIEHVVDQPCEPLGFHRQLQQREAPLRLLAGHVHLHQRVHGALQKCLRRCNLVDHPLVERLGYARVEDGGTPGRGGHPLLGLDLARHFAAIFAFGSR